MIAIGAEFKEGVRGLALRLSYRLDSDLPAWFLTSVVILLFENCRWSSLWLAMRR
jgi:hypothetical protein